MCVEFAEAMEHHLGFASSSFSYTQNPTLKTLNLKNTDPNYAQTRPHEPSGFVDTPAAGF